MNTFTYLGSDIRKKCYLFYYGMTMMLDFKCALL